MVKAPRTVNLDPLGPRLAHEYLHGEYEQVTIMDVQPSLHSMVTTGIVGNQMGNSRYVYPDLGDEDEAHEHPDYQRVNDMDNVEKQEFAEMWLKNPKFYEKKKESEPEAQTETPKNPEEGAAE